MNKIKKDFMEKQLSPCIISWARFALEIKSERPINTKKCSRNYWIKVLDYLLIKFPKKIKNKERAINKYEDYVGKT